MRAVNLIPEEQRRGAGGLAGRSGGAAYVALALIVGIACLAALYGMARNEISSREGEVAKLAGEARRAEAETAALAPYTRFDALREERLKAVRQLADTRFDWAHAMHELGRVLPSDVSLTGVSGTIAAPPAAPSTSTASAPGGAASTSSPVTSATPPGSAPTFSISACTTGQAAVAEAIDRLRLMNGVSEVLFHSSTDAAAASSKTSASASSSSATASTCPDTFSLQVNYEPLPAPKEPTPTARSTAEAGR